MLHTFNNKSNHVVVAEFKTSLHLHLSLLVCAVCYCPGTLKHIGPGGLLKNILDK